MREFIKFFIIFFVIVIVLQMIWTMNNSYLILSIILSSLGKMRNCLRIWTLSNCVAGMSLVELQYQCFTSFLQQPVFSSFFVG